MASFVYLYSILVLLSSLIAFVKCDADLEWQGWLKANVFYDRDTYQVQKILTVLNMFGFCILPRPTSTTLKFL